MKNLAIILGLMIAASPAFASRARLESLGEGKNGSFYVSDARNIFLNPAQIVKHKKKLWLEFGGDTVGSRDSATAPRGQGGFSNTFGDFTYGVYLNNTSDRSINTFSSVGFLTPDSQLEAFFAGEGGMNWGISLFYAGNSALNQTVSIFGTRLGIESGNFAVFTTVGIASKATNGATEAKGKISIDGGLTYAMENTTFFGKFSTFGVETSGVEAKQMSFGAGFGCTKEWSKTVTSYSRLEFDHQKTTVAGVDSKLWNVPVVLGAEAQALSWLAVRGSVAMSLLGQSDVQTQRSLSGTTTVAAGLGATFGDVNIDGVISTGTVTTTDIPGFGTGANTSGNAFGFGNNMLSRVALTYNF